LSKFPSGSKPTLFTMCPVNSFTVNINPVVGSWLNNVLSVFAATLH